MIETFTALLFAHVVADFVVQTRTMVQQKSGFAMMALHAALALATAQAATGHLTAPVLLAVTAAHIAIDLLKTHGGFRSFTAFMIDQAAHVVTLGIAAAYAPDLWATGVWAGAPWLLPLMALASGLIVTLLAGQHAIALLMRPHGTRIRNNGLRDGGRQIGLLERGLIFLFLLTGHPIGAGVLIGAKSILRFGTASRDQRTAEYVIIGTLASFGWAIVAALLTQAALGLLPPLEITRPAS
ncbi:DUF3307 domain-containing protein [Thalassorhabdomicrobium marinisediminis]|uniref:DUF3307 domain-containing protein n=1 Tax=Thalassorhabdomicrobium marinisediminis TaxID=2170577 RepID=A0A2T7FVC4_9RHOB|nr:DUF3307 domain-containing protein [Thalassorhabdomicrobium marinisediminis]PVA06130.1 DUF3307 domain-containing protein [Thalassorhabdomicrobium marinisediminis]